MDLTFRTSLRRRGGPLTGSLAPTVDSGARPLLPAFLVMAKQSVTPSPPKPVEPGKSPQPDRQPYKDPVKESPFDPPDERPLIDPRPPEADQPRMQKSHLSFCSSV